MPAALPLKKLIQKMAGKPTHSIAAVQLVDGINVIQLQAIYVRNWATKFFRETVKTRQVLSLAAMLLGNLAASAVAQ